MVSTGFQNPLSRVPGIPGHPVKPSREVSITCRQQLRTGSLIDCPFLRGVPVAVQERY